MSKTMIDYADDVWNPITGCTKVSEGCKNCWAERFSPRLKVDFSKVTVHQDRIDNPKFPRRPSRIFVCSMSDLFHELVPDETIHHIHYDIRRYDIHTFILLTKRPKRAYDYYKKHPLMPCKNIWLGVSVEDQKTADERIPILLQTPAVVRWVSAEPLLEQINFTIDVCPGCGSDLSKKDCGCPAGTGKGFEYEYVSKNKHWGIDWLVTGGESGPNSRPSHPDWFRSLRDQCKAAGVPFWFKQWGNWAPTLTGEMKRYSKNLTGSRLDGKTYNELPKG